MNPVVPQFDFSYDAPDIYYGQRCVERLESVLTAAGLNRALVVCGSTVGSSPSVIDPVTDGLGDVLVGVYDGTVPSKNVEAARDGVDVMQAADADVLVTLGGGSSLDLAKAMTVIDASARSYDDLISVMIEEGELPLSPTRSPPKPTVLVPTTLAGADLSFAGSVTLPSADPTDQPHRGHIADERLMPLACFYDVDLFATTPESVLVGSAMNGFDKGLEMLYSPNATPITDATAMNGLRHFRSGLPHVLDADSDDEALQASVIGAILVQYGHAVPGSPKFSILHAFGHLSRFYDAQQGTVHGIVAPHVLRYLFGEIDGRRRLIADGLGVDTDGKDDEALADAIVETVANIRNSLGLATQLRSIPDLDRNDLPTAARTVAGDWNMQNLPSGLDPTTKDLEEILRRAW